MEWKNVFVVGCGLMGSGIAQVCAQAGFRVVVCDVREEVLGTALGKIAWSVEKLAEKGTLGEPASEILSRITPSVSYEAASEADVAIEAVFEDLQTKRDALRKLDEVAPPRTILASNTSAISISLLAGMTRRPERFLGLHFFSPVPLMGVAEVIRGMDTDDACFAAGLAFIRRLGKEPIPVLRDVPAFVINRINYRANIEAMKLVEEGGVTVEDVDKGLRLGAGRKMGPFEIGDMVGLDVTCGALMSIYEDTKDASFYPPAILRRKIQRGELGRKTGKGWYEYDADGTIKK